MNPCINILKRRVKDNMHQREEKVMTSSTALHIADRLDRRLFGLVLNVRERVAMGIEEAVEVS